MNTEKLFVIVPSTDSYSFLWPGITKKLNKFWQFKSTNYILSEQMKGNINSFTIFNSAKDLGWNRNLSNFLKTFEFDYCIICLDDAPPNKPVEQLEINNLISLMKKHDLKYINLKGVPKPRGLEIEKDIRSIKDTQKFKASLHMGLWEKNELQKILDFYKSPWELEWDKLKKVTYRKGYASLIGKKKFSYDHIIIGGKINFKAFNKIYKKRKPFKVISFLEYKLHLTKIFLFKIKELLFSLIK
tara:strand:+ start:944 stop:1672 length:729 start_codon:yes stop_codon:yes gene_type:complete